MNETLRVAISADGDRIWLYIGLRRVAFIRTKALDQLCAPSDFGPQELVPVVGSEREQ